VSSNVGSLTSTPTITTEPKTLSSNTHFSERFSPESDQTNRERQGISVLFVWKKLFNNIHKILLCDVCSEILRLNEEIKQLQLKMKSLEEEKAQHPITLNELREKERTYIQQIDSLRQQLDKTIQEHNLTKQVSLSLSLSCSFHS
jgi:ABC-type phosphate transport system auxiliary subunit